LRIAAGLEAPDSGDVVLNGSTVTASRAADRDMAMVFQSYALYPHMSVRENLAFGLRLQKVPADKIEAAVKNASEILHIEHLLDRKPKALSGGQRQRVAIGRAITREPRIFLFDEPLSNLDAELRVQMRLELSKLHNDLGSTMIYVTHDQVEAMTMANRIVVLRDGRIEQVGTPLDLYNRPANRFVAGFIGSPRMNFLSASVAEARGNSITVTLQGLPAISAPVSGVNIGENVTLGIRPENLLPAEEGWPLEVDLVEQLGGISYIHGRLPSGDRLVVSASGQTRLRSGETIRISAQVEALHVFSSATGEPALLRTANQ
jgi:ABC-type sugar transport system ATPase subunit